MKAIIIADAHVHPWRDCSRNGGADRLADGLSVVLQSLELARTHVCKWVSLGDIKLLRGIWPQDALSGLLHLMREYPDVKKVMLPGNGGHDGVGTKATGEGGYDPFRGYATIMDTPRVDGGTAWWPWQPQHAAPALLASLLDDARRSRVRIVCGHAMFSGSVVGTADFKLEKGYALSDFGLSGTKSERVFDWGFFGDVHKRQVLGDVTQKAAAAVYVPGSPYAQNWGELELDKGCLFVDLARGVVEPIPLIAPRYHVITVADGTSMRDVQRQTDVHVGDFVRLVTEAPVRAVALEALRAAWKPRVLETGVLPQSAPVTGARRSAAHGAMTRGELFNEYIKAVPPPDGVAVEGVQKAAQTILQRTTR